MTRASSRCSVDVLVPDWPAPARVRAAMTLRTGGVSSAPYDTLNLGAHVGDYPAAVAENRRRVRESLQLPSEPVWLEQVHGTDVAILDEPAPARDPDVVGATPPAGAGLLVGTRGDEPRAGGRAAATATTHRVEVSATHAADLAAAQRAGVAAVRRADAAVTHSPGLVCAIQVADCMPVLFAARDGTAVGAAHAGWRGLVGGVLEATVAALRCPARELLAWLGPAISQPHFEVGDEVRAAFIAHDSAAAAAFVPNARGRWQCDLYALARQRLTALGIRHISGGEYCTYADRARFFSYRRDGRCGRMAAFVWLAPS